jgi:hypothetical protein
MPLNLPEDIIYTIFKGQKRLEQPQNGKNFSLYPAQMPGKAVELPICGRNA